LSSDHLAEVHALGAWLVTVWPRRASLLGSYRMGLVTGFLTVEEYNHLSAGGWARNGTEGMEFGANLIGIGQRPNSL